MPVTMSGVEEKISSLLLSTLLLHMLVELAGSDSESEAPVSEMGLSRVLNTRWGLSMNQNDQGQNIDNTILPGAVLKYLVSCWGISDGNVQGESSGAMLVGGGCVRLGSNMKPSVSRLSLQEIPAWSRVLLSSRIFLPWSSTPTRSPLPRIVVIASTIVLCKRVTRLNIN